MFLWRGNAPHTLALVGLEAEITSQWYVLSEQPSVLNYS